MRSTARRRTALTISARNVAGVMGGPLSQPVLDAGMTVLLRQTPEAASLVAEAFHLAPEEQSWLQQVGPDEGLLTADGRRLAFEAVASDEERRLIAAGGAR